MRILSQIGVGGRLTAAFTAVGGVTVILAGMGVYGLSTLSQSQQNLVERDMPALENAITLMRSANDITALADAIITADSRRKINELDEKFKGEIDQLEKAAKRIDNEELTDAIEVLDTEANYLIKRSKQKISLMLGMQAARTQVQQNHKKFLTASAKHADDAYFEAYMAAETEETVTNIQERVQESVNTLMQVGRIRANTNLLSGLVVATATATEKEALPTLADRLRSTRNTIQRAQNQMGEVDPPRSLKRITQLASPEGGIIDLRRKLLTTQNKLETDVAKTRRAAETLREVAGQRVNDARTHAEKSARAAKAEATQGRWIMLGSGGVGLALIGLTVIGYVRPQIVTRLRVLRSEMDAVTRDDLDRDIDANGSDEIADMARSLRTFRDSRSEVKRLEAERAEADRRAEEQKQQALQEMADDLERTIGQIVENVREISGKMEESANTMSSTAEQTLNRGVEAATASEQAAQNVATVSTSAEELSSSIQEIGRQGTTTSEIAEDVAQRVEKTSEQMQNLDSAAREIDNVIQLIENIAEQTNLLALNATIEAERAGEAGSGFEVVAREVKSLANQTHESTQEVRSQVEKVQAEAASAVDAVNGIGERMGTMREVSQSVSTAVEEQQQAVDEISRNAHEANTGVQNASQQVEDVKEAANSSTRTAETLQEIVNRLSEASEKLDADTRKFLERIRNGSDDR